MSWFFKLLIATILIIVFAFFSVTGVVSSPARVYSFGSDLLSKLFTETGLWKASVSSANEPIQLAVTLPREVSSQVQASVEVAVGSASFALEDANDRQDKIDDLLERIDLLKAELAKLAVVDNSQAPKKQDDRLDVNKIDADQPVVQDNYVKTAIAVPIYPKIIISEVQVGSGLSAKQEFVELYNPNPKDVDLTHWYLQRRTKTGSGYSTYASANSFSNKSIPAHAYFLIARQGFFTGFADVYVNSSLTNDNTLALKDPNGGTSDKVGFGEVVDYETAPAQNPDEGQGIGRKSFEQDTDDNSNDFELDIPTPRAGNISFKDFTASHALKNPQVVFDIQPSQPTLQFPVNVTINGVASSSITGYVFRMKENEADWQSDDFFAIDGAPTIFSKSKNIVGVNGSTYYFQIKTKDADGNESGWQPETPATTVINVPKKIVINRVQTDGQSSKDEFIELYNPNEVDIDLVGFTLKKKTSTGTESNLVSSEAFSGIIKAGGSFLIAPQDDSDGTKNYMGSVLPDLRYSGSSFSITPNNTILLCNADAVLLDKVGFGTAIDFETTATENPPTGKSISRTSGFDSDNNAEDFHPPDILPPQISFGAPSGELVSGTVQINIGVQTNEMAVCRYATTVGQDFDGMADVFLTADGFMHSATINGLSDGNRYVYYIRCKDVFGNKNVNDAVISFDVAIPAPPAEPPVEPPAETPTPQLSVVVNEIAWMGSPINANAEWIELFNPTDSTVDLLGWTLKASDGTPSINLTGGINAHSCYLLERTSDDAVPSVIADKIYIGALGNSGENLLLVDSFGNVVDRVDSVPWFAGDNMTKKTMQRKDPLVSGNDPANWQTSEAVGGTPKS